MGFFSSLLVHGIEIRAHRLSQSEALEDPIFLDDNLY